MPSSQFCKEVFEHLRAFFCHKSAVKSGLEAESFFKNIDNSAAGTHIGVGSAKHHLVDARIEDSAGAHGAGLEGDVHGASAETAVAHGKAGVVYSQYLGVVEGVLGLLTAVSSLGHDDAVSDYNTANGYFTLGGGIVSKLERPLHKKFFRHKKSPFDTCECLRYYIDR